jgi:hypothetical protein
MSWSTRLGSLTSVVKTLESQLDRAMGIQTVSSLKAGEVAAAPAAAAEGAPSAPAPARGATPEAAPVAEPDAQEDVLAAAAAMEEDPWTAAAALDGGGEPDDAGALGDDAGETLQALPGDSEEDPLAGLPLADESVAEIAEDAPAGGSVRGVAEEEALADAVPASQPAVDTADTADTAHVDSAAVAEAALPEQTVDTAEREDVPAGPADISAEPSPRSSAAAAPGAASVPVSASEAVAEYEKSAK